MLLHPDEALSVDELLQKIYDERLTAAAKTGLLAQAEARGLSWKSVMLEMVDEWSERMADPLERARILAREERRECPLRRDPLEGKMAESEL